MIVGLRRSDVTVQDVDRETMVYNPGTREFHLLNDVAAFAFGHADGCATAQDLLEGASEALGRDVTIVEMEAAIAELDRVDLLDHSGESNTATVTRRDAVRRLSAVAFALPFITTMLAPSTAMARSSGQAAPKADHGNDDDHSSDKKWEEDEKKAKEERESKVKEERESKEKEERESKAKAEQESKAKAEQESKAKAEQETKVKEQSARHEQEQGKKRHG